VQFAVLVILPILFLLAIRSGYKSFLDQRKNRTCPHNIIDGKTRKLCAVCERERLEAEERARQARLEQERARLIAEAAAKLRRKEAIRLGSIIVPTLDELRRLTSQQFEDEVAKMYERLGYSVEQTPYTNDHGRDAILKKDGRTILLECKKYGANNSSGRPEIQKFLAAIKTDEADTGIFVTTGKFTSGAVEFAAHWRIELVDGTALQRYMVKSKPRASGSDTYASMCTHCGSLVQHSLRRPTSEKCANGHVVVSSLDLESIMDIAIDPTPQCDKCGSRMRKVKRRGRRPFWGCSRFPVCRSYKPYRRQQDNAQPIRSAGFRGIF
jgi:hypothetical protein